MAHKKIHPFSHKPTERETRDSFTRYRKFIYNCCNRYVLPDDQDVQTSANKLIKQFEGAPLFCKGLGAPFVVNELTRRHIILKARSAQDRERRSHLLPSGIEIAEESRTVISVDAKTDEVKQIVYYEIIGTDTQRFPGKIIVVKLSECMQGGKALFTVYDIEER